MGRKGKVDINHAAPEDMERLAGLSAAEARAIVDFRAERPFRSMEDLEKIPGVGKGAVKKLRENAWFSLEAEEEAVGGVDINRAGEEELMSLPGVGRKGAETILAYRRKHGKFKSLDDLEKIRGFGPRMLESLRDKVHF